VPAEPSVPDVPEVPDVPAEPSVPEVPAEPAEPEEPCTPATFRVSNIFVALFQTTTLSEEPDTNVPILILPLTPILPLIVSDAFIVWSLLICKNDAVSVFPEDNANIA
jgi:hypothetical protein